MSTAARFTNCLDLLKDIYSVQNTVTRQKLMALIYKMDRLAKTGLVFTHNLMPAEKWNKENTEKAHFLFVNDNKNLLHLCI